MISIRRIVIMNVKAPRTSILLFIDTESGAHFIAILSNNVCAYAWWSLYRDNSRRNTEGENELRGEFLGAKRFLKQVRAVKWECRWMEAQISSVDWIRRLSILSKAIYQWSIW